MTRDSDRFDSASTASRGVSAVLAMAAVLAIAACEPAAREGASWDSQGGSAAADGDPTASARSALVDGGAPWAQGYGSPGWDDGRSIVSDASGNYYVSGEFEGTIDFGAGPLTSAGQSDVFLLKLDPTGSVIWSRRYGTEFDDRSGVMTVDGNGNIFLAGVYGGIMGAIPGPDFGGGPIAGADYLGIFVVKFDPGGDHVWSGGYEVFAPSSLRDVAEVAVDAVGNVYMLVRIDDYTYLAKVGAGGAGILWTQLIPISDVSNGAVSLAVDSAGNVIVANEDPIAFWNLAAEYFIVSKFDPTGALVWLQMFESDGAEGAFSVAVNASDEILVAGFTDGTIDFGGGVLPAGPVLVELDSAGQHIFSRSVRFGNKIALDPTGGVIVAGGGLARLDASGNELWWVDFDPLVEDIAIAPDGTVAVTGSMLGPVDFGTGPIAYTASHDIFVAAFDP
ncbi:hypothetical protein WMF30_23630 [Sorangium sp. So ce134]